MKKHDKELKFISQIKRDGSGVIPCLSDNHMLYLDDNLFSINCLSLTKGTYIASGFNSFVVKLKN